MGNLSEACQHFFRQPRKLCKLFSLTTRFKVGIITLSSEHFKMAIDHKLQKKLCAKSKAI